MKEVLQSSRELDKWYKLLAKGKEVKDWQTLLSGWNSCTDVPCCLFWREICAANPKALVVHTVRDAEEWYKSTYETIYTHGLKMHPLWLRATVPWVYKLYHMQRALMRKMFHDRFEDREYAIRVYNEHNYAVRAGVPEERLLVFNVKEGWEPLCKFLKVPVPDAPFPHVNDRVEVIKLLYSLRRAAIVQAAAVLLAALAVLVKVFFPVTGRKH